MFHRCALIGRPVIFFLFVMVSGAVFSQGSSDWKQHFKISGFVKSNYWFDSRKVDGSRDDLFLYYPKKPAIDPAGNDINKAFNANFSAINTRLALTINGPQLLNAVVTGYIESDYTGVTNADVDGLRLRHAFVKLRWTNDELLLGQYWHPMFVPEVFPEVFAFNTGAPFQPFIRNPQLSYKHHFERITLEAAFIMQRDNNSDGPLGRSHIYMQEAGIPNSHLQLVFKPGKHIFGAALDHKVIQPRTITDKKFKTDELLPSLSGMLFWKWKKAETDVSFKAIVGQNLTEHLMLGGYAVATYDSLTGLETYTPTNHLFLWGGMHYGNQYRWGLFGGYAKNFGTSVQNAGIYYGKGSDVDQLFRLSPSFSYRNGPLCLASELEWTIARFGIPDEHGRVKQTSPTHNVRLLLVATYFFKN